MSTALHDERMRRFARAGLYLVTSRTLSAGRTTVEIVRAALEAGVSLFQLREKDVSDRELYETAVQVRSLTARAGALLLINDRVDMALAVGADGVHLGQDDMPLAAARQLAPDLILGASSHAETEARDAERAGASYVNIGPLYPTNTKEWTRAYLGVEGLRRVSRVLRVPFTVMGGIKARHIPELAAAGARTFAVVTAVTGAGDPGQAAAELLATIRLRAP